MPAAAPLKSDWKENVFWLSGGEEDRVQYWQARWATGQSQWNSEKPHQYLVKVSLSAAAAAVLVSSDPTLLMHSIWMCWPEDPRASASSCLCAARLETSCTSTTKVTLLVPVLDTVCYLYSFNIRSHCHRGRRCSLRSGAIFPGEQAGVWEGLSSLCCPRQKWIIWLIFYNVQVSLPEIRGWKYNVIIEIHKLRLANIYCVLFRQKITGCVSTLVISSASPPRWLARWTPCTTGEPLQAETGLSPWWLQLTIIPPRGALEAVNVGDRQGYVKLMQSLLGKDFRCRIMIIY